MELTLKVYALVDGMHTLLSASKFKYTLGLKISAAHD